jgi:hypothetical protein
MSRTGNLCKASMSYAVEDKHAKSSIGKTNAHPYHGQVINASSTLRERTATATQHFGFSQFTRQ